MTTKITVEANHGWPVRVTIIDKASEIIHRHEIVKANTKQDFFVFDTRDIFIHEIQPDDKDFKDNK